MDFEEYRKHDAVGLAGLVSKGEVTPPELLEVAVSRMAAVDPKINAVTMDLTESIAPRSDQVNTDDMIGGPATVTIETVVAGSAEQPVDIGVQVRFGKGVRLVHLGLRKWITFSSCSFCRSIWRARERRDMTVPIGISMISATSW